jgi:hypothetical protein
MQILIIIHLIRGFIAKKNNLEKSLFHFSTNYQKIPPYLHTKTLLFHAPNSKTP